MPINYIYKKYKDVHTIENTGLTSLQYRIDIVECNNTSLYKEGVIEPGIISILPILFHDATYSITLTNALNESETLPDILQYSNLLYSFIESVEETLCGCKKCKDCEECNDCETSINTTNQMLAYLYVNAPKYDTYLAEIISQLKCLYTEEVLCTINKKMITGNSDTKSLFFQIIGTHYLAFYLIDLVQAIDEEEAEYIKLKYKSSKVLKCLRKIGININEYTNLIGNNMLVHYWQINDLLQDINDIIPIFNNLYLTDKPSVPFEEFEVGKIVTYSTVGRIAFVIKETEILNFQISDSLGNDVTDEFEDHYFATEKAVLFVSKIPYSHSSIYFKFKKIGITGDGSSSCPDTNTGGFFNDTFNNTFN